MAAISRIINVQVSLFTVAVKVASFDGLMVVDYFPVSSYFPGRVMAFETASDANTTLKVSGGANAPGALAAVNAAFAQSPQISQVYVGRRNTNPVLRVELTPVAFNSRIYKVWVNGVVASYTSDSSATVAEICTGLTTALNALSGTPVAATDGTTKITIVATVSGTYYTVDIDNVELLKSQQTHSLGTTSVTDDLDAILAENSDWYTMTMTTSGLAENTAALGWANTNKKIFVCATQDWDCTDTTSETASIAYVNHNATYDYGVVMFHAKPSEHIGAAWLAKTLTNAPGSVTFKFKRLAGVSADVLTTTRMNNLDAKKANYFVSYGGNNAITAEGFAGSGEYIDVIRDSDWFSSRLQTRIYAILVNNAKVLYTQKGINMLAGAVRAQVKEAQVAGFLNDDPSTVVFTVPNVNDISSNTKATRVLTGLAVTAQLAGAVHKVSPLTVNISA